ncbi:SRPBCC family protein [Mycobacterium sp. NPDC003323]
MNVAVTHLCIMTMKVTRTAALAALLYGMRRYWRNWGTTKDECAMRLPGDEVLSAPVVTSTEGMWIDHPPEEIWPWLVRMSGSSDGLYTYGIADAMPGRTHCPPAASPAARTELAVGDTVTLVASGAFGRRDGVALPVQQVITGEAIVLHGGPPVVPWDVVWSIHLLPRWNDRCRVLVRTRVGLRHPGEVLSTALLGPAFSVLTRRLLLTISRLSGSKGATSGVPVEVAST